MTGTGWGVRTRAEKWLGTVSYRRLLLHLSWADRNTVPQFPCDKELEQMHPKVIIWMSPCPTGLPALMWEPGHVPKLVTSMLPPLQCWEP